MRLKIFTTNACLCSGVYAIGRLEKVIQKNLKANLKAKLLLLQILGRRAATASRK